MPMDDTDHSMGDPEPTPEPPRPRSRDNADDRDYTTPERVEEHAEETQLPRTEGAPPNEHPEDGRSRAAGKPWPEPGPPEE